MPIAPDGSLLPYPEDQQSGQRHERIKALFDQIRDILAEDGSVDEIDELALQDSYQKILKALAERTKQADQMLQGRIDPRAARRLA